MDIDLSQAIEDMTKEDRGEKVPRIERHNRQLEELLKQRRQGQAPKDSQSDRRNG